MPHLDLVALVVREYDPAIDFFVNVLQFALAEDIPALTNDGRPKRWVVVRPPGGGPGILLARADGDRQAKVVGEQFAGRVGFFLRVDDFEATHARMTTAGVRFVSPARTAPYGRVAVFLDCEGNRWDLLGPATVPDDAPQEALHEQFGDIDIYLFDQLLRGRIPPGSRVFDAGCGRGRNLVHLLRAGFEVFAADPDPVAVAAVRQMAASLSPRLPATNFRAEPMEALSFPDALADVVVCSAVLHFARDDNQFNAMLDGAWRVLRPGGLFFCRLASSIGMEQRVRRIDGRRFLLPDGSERYLVDEALILEQSRRLGGSLIDPIKTTIVQNQRCMTTWVMQKEA